MDELWIGGFGTLPNAAGSAYAANTASRASAEVQSMQLRVRDLEHQVQRLALLNQALWEILRDRAKISEEQFQEKVREVDLRDGLEDGRLSAVPLRCPTCSRISNSRHYKCLYCGQLFEKPTFG